MSERIVVPADVFGQRRFAAFALPGYRPHAPAIRLDQADPGEPEFPQLHRNAAGFLEQLKTVMNAHDCGIDPGEHGVNPVQAGDFRLRPRAFGDLRLQRRGALADQGLQVLVELRALDRHRHLAAHGFQQPQVVGADDPAFVPDHIHDAQDLVAGRQRRADMAAHLDGVAAVFLQPFALDQRRPVPQLPGLQHAPAAAITFHRFRTEQDPGQFAGRGQAQAALALIEKHPAGAKARQLQNPLQGLFAHLDFSGHPVQVGGNAVEHS